MPFTAAELEKMKQVDAEIDAEFESPEFRRKLSKAEYNHKYYMNHCEKICGQTEAYRKSHPEKGANGIEDIERIIQKSVGNGQKIVITGIWKNVENIIVNTKRIKNPLSRLQP